MGRRNTFLVVSLLVMIAALLGALLFLEGNPSTPLLGTDTASTDEVDREVPAGSALDASLTDQGGDTAAPLREGVTAPEGASGGAPAVLGGRLIGPDGAGVAGISLTATRAPVFGGGGIGGLLRGRGQRSEEDVVARPVTDEQGRFSFQFPRGTDGLLWIQPAAPADAETNPVMFADGRAHRFPAFLDDGDLGELEVVQSARVSGVCRDGTGRPVAGVKVRVRGLREAGFAGVSTNTTTDGEFSISGIRPGPIEITTSTPDFQQSELELELQPGEHREGVEIGLEGGARIAGIVLDDLGRPVEGARVGIGRWRDIGSSSAVNSGLPTRMQTFDDADTVETDASGRFELNGLDRSSVTLRVMHEDFQPVVRRDVVAGVATIELHLQRLATVSGTLVDAQGEPIAGSEVRPGGTSFIGPFGVVGANLAVTDEDGAFTLSGVMPGRIVLTASGDHRPAESAPIDVSPGQVLDDVRIVAYSGTTLVATVLDPTGAPVEGAEVVVKEQRQRGQGREMTGVFRERVEVAGGPGGEEVRILGGGDLGSAITDAEGIARIHGLEAGTADVVASHEDAAASNPVPVELPRDGRVESLLTLRRGARVEVSVVDALGKPVGQIPFVIRGPQLLDPVRGESGGDGRAIVGPLPAGAYDAMLERGAEVHGAGTFVFSMGEEQAIESTKVSFEVPRQSVDGEPVKVQLQEPVRATIIGKVMGAEGPVAGAEMSLVDATAQFAFLSPGTKRAVSGEDGGYVFEDVEPGEWTVRYARPGALAPHEKDLEIAPGIAEVRENLLLQEGVVELRVMSTTTGKPLADARITPSRVRESSGGGEPQRAVAVSFVTEDGGGGTGTSFELGGGGGQAVRTDAEGHATLELPAGKWRLSVRHEDHEELELDPIDLRPLQTLDLGVHQVSSAFVMTGRVVGADGKVVEGFALVEVREVGAQPRNPVVAQNGSFRIPSLAPGSYEVRTQVVGMEGPGTWSEWQSVVVGAGATNQVDVRTK